MGSPRRCGLVQRSGYITGYLAPLCRPAAETGEAPGHRPHPGVVVPGPGQLDDVLTEYPSPAAQKPHFPTVELVGGAMEPELALATRPRVQIANR